MVLTEEQGTPKKKTKSEPKSMNPTAPPGKKVKEGTKNTIAKNKGKITEMTVTDSDGRSVKQGKVLQIVAPPANPSVGVAKEYGGEDDDGGDVPGGKTFTLGASIQGGGQEEIKVEIKTSNGKRPQIAWEPGGGNPTNWKKGPKQTFKAKYAGAERLFPKVVKPDKYTVWGRGEDDAQKLKVTVESYPTQQVELSAEREDLEYFEKKVEALEKRLVGKFNKRFGLDKAKDDKTNKAVSLKPKLIRPKGEVTIALGWKEEEKSPKVFFEVELKAALAPVFGISLKFRMSFAHLAATAALTSAGFPPPVAGKLAKLGTEWLADAWMSLSLSTSLSLTGSGTVAFYPGGGKKKGGKYKNEVKITPKVDGKISVEVGVRLGGENWASASIKGTASSGISITGALEILEDGIFFDPALKWAGVKGTVEWEAKAGIFEVKGEKEWQIIEAATIWKLKKGKLQFA